MKRVVSISLGDSSRDHRASMELLGQSFNLERKGTNGDIKKAIAMIKDMDGKVDAFGMGGIDLYIYVGNRRYEIREAKALKNAPKITPIVDGSGLKNTLERRVIQYLNNEKIVDFKRNKVLLVSAADRFGMAEALEEIGSNVIYGDLMFTLGIPYPLKSIKTFYKVANLIAPIAVNLPFKMLYPTGTKQSVNYKCRYEAYYHDANIIAGDYHYIKKYMPSSLKDKIIITNTTTEEDVAVMKEKGLAMLVTTTPEVNGRSFGTNVLEAVLLSIIGKRPDDVSPKDYFSILEDMKFAPRILDFKSTHQLNATKEIG